MSDALGNDYIEVWIDYTNTRKNKKKIKLPIPSGVGDWISRVILKTRILSEFGEHIGRTQDGYLAYLKSENLQQKKYP